ncbi:exonuclease subunit SbcD [Algibacillus agarilyticus]|uniref:exonuclease subunit SbcD n=1 Tax=Algibacillus agarilyticus TaxID=2234133 RepID=UPI000DCFEF33|nr:exonuclease subunit SbcD [Algibacillus agarilyticus]
MKIMHTSDWHLGQSFYGKSRAPEHKLFFNWLIEQVKTHNVDAIIVAGDIFDTGTPPSYARELYNQFVVDLQRTRCQLVILAGNHDSVATLNESKQLFSYLNTHLLAGVDTNDIDAQLVELGQVDNKLQSMVKVGALVCAIPYIRPRDIVSSQAGQSGRDKQQSLQQAIAEHYQALYQKAQARVAKLGYPVPIIMTGHLTTLGASTSDSVRDIYIGTLDAFPANAFPPADYIALGHIHRSQCVAKSEHIRYSGSPIALSFDELNRAKTVNLVEFTQAELSHVTPLEVPEFQSMQTIKGNLATIAERLAEFEEAEPNEPVTWLDIEVSEQDYLSDLQTRIESLSANRPVEVLVIRRKKNVNQSNLQQQEKETLAELTAHDVFERRLALEKINDAVDEKQTDQLKRLRLLFDQSVQDVTHEQEPNA